LTLSTLAGLRGDMIRFIPKIRRLTFAESVKIENGEESFTVVVAWPAGQYVRAFTANDTETKACRHRDEIIKAVLDRRLRRPG
jgi:hypothetical protein